jgi:hypothetical protein
MTENKTSKTTCTVPQDAVSYSSKMTAFTKTMIDTTARDNASEFQLIISRLIGDESIDDNTHKALRARLLRAGRNLYNLGMLVERISANHQD